MTIIDLAIKAAREAGDILQHFAARGFRVETKGRIDLVTEADLASEKRGEADSADVARNAAFFHATRGAFDDVIACLSRAMDREPTVTARYIEDEVEFRRFQEDARFRALRSSQ